MTETIKEEIKTEPAEMPFSNSCLIVRDIFNAMEKHPSRYSYETAEGLQQLQILAVRLAQENVPSYRGAFQQAKLAGFCITSGWWAHHQLLNQNEQTEELLSLENVLSIPEFTKLHQMGLTEENGVERSLVFGFRCGVRLGYMARQKITTTESGTNVITTQKLISYLKETDCVTMQSPHFIHTHAAPIRLTEQKQFVHES